MITGARLAHEITLEECQMVLADRVEVSMTEPTAASGARGAALGSRFETVARGGDGTDRDPAPPSSVGDGSCVDVPTPYAVLATVERKVFTVTNLGAEVYAVEATTRRRDSPQLALKPVDLTSVVSEHPARGALLDRSLYAFPAGGVPMIIG
jgi:hypothetical protein